MQKIKVVTYYDKTVHHWYKCPGCGYEHAFSAERHVFNGDLNNPTVTPSLLQSNPQQHHTCHSYITDGKIKFLDDCWHELRGKTVELPEYTEEELKRDIFS